jgi:exonuclease SbcD
MPIQLLHVSDIHLGSGETHGSINPETGLNVRFEDFAAALVKSVDYALQNRIDVYLFSGDAYKSAAPEPIYQKAFAAQLKRLSDAGIQTILLVGNHDQVMRSTASHSMSVFESLSIPHVFTIDQPVSQTVKTGHGPLQVVGIPHVTRHLLMTHDRYGELSSASIDKQVVNHVDALLKDFLDELNPEFPAIATAHMMVDRARAGAEQELMVGYSMTFPMDIFVHPHLDYVALGHVHAHQVLRKDKPAIVYAGSLERVDFSEESQDKGFLHVHLERGATTYKFISIEPRPFITLDADVTQSVSPTETLSSLLQSQVQPGSVVRLRYKVLTEQLPEIDEAKLRMSAQPALSIKFKPEIVASERPTRMPDLNETAAASPLTALEQYLEKTAPDRKDQLLARARLLAEKLQDTD